MGAEIGFMGARRDPGLKERCVRALVWGVIFALMFPVNNAVHLGGFSAGLAQGWWLERQRRPYRLDRLFAGLAAVTGVVVLLSLVLSQTSEMWQQQRAVELDARGLG